MTIQGAKDADLVNFYGSRQYGRTTLSPGTEAFKASLYVEDANHSRFNTDWGSSDSSGSESLLVRPDSRISADEQQEISQGYVTAFAEAVLLGDDRYRALFRDYRAGAAFLPDTMPACTLSATPPSAHAATSAASA